MPVPFERYRDGHHAGGRFTIGGKSEYDLRPAAAEE